MALSNFFARTKPILLVEDDIKLRSALKDEFESSGMTVLEAGDAGEVLSLLGSHEPAAIVLDLILPLKDGISLLEELRAQHFTMPVVILSNLLGSESLREDAHRLDASFYNKSSTSLEDIVQDVIKQIK